jgi:hypothetical protein
MNERDKYPNLDPEVVIHHCTKTTPMPLEIAGKLVELKQLWIHDDVEEVGESDDGRYVNYACDSCGHNFWLDLGD